MGHSALILFNYQSEDFSKPSRSEVEHIARRKAYRPKVQLVNKSLLVNWNYFNEPRGFIVILYKTVCGNNGSGVGRGQLGMFSSR